jgi:hypothetical protein
MFNGYMEAGYNTYKLNAKNLASGVYYYVLKTDNFSQTKKLAIIK